MSFTDCLSIAVQNLDADVPDHLLPTTIMDSASMMAHMSSDTVGAQAWF